MQNPSTAGARSTKSSRGHKGVTLIELMVTITLLALLLLLGVPSFTQWIRNNEIRSTAEKLQNGLRLARASAMTLNRQVVFATLSGTPALNATAVADKVNWFVQTIPITSGEANQPKFIEGGSFASDKTDIKVSGGPAALCFNSVGLVVANTATGVTENCAASAATYVVERTAAATGDRKLHVMVLLSGGIRMCDPARPSTAPDGCP